jgi:hypothetical protein
VGIQNLTILLNMFLDLLSSFKWVEKWDELLSFLLCFSHTFKRILKVVVNPLCIA